MLKFQLVFLLLVCGLLHAQVISLPENWSDWTASYAHNILVCYWRTDDALTPNKHGKLQFKHRIEFKAVKIDAPNAGLKIHNVFCNEMSLNPEAVDIEVNGTYKSYTFDFIDDQPKGAWRWDSRVLKPGEDESWF